MAEMSSVTQKACHTAAGLCGEKMTEQEKSTTIFVPLSYHGGGSAVKRFCRGGGHEKLFYFILTEYLFYDKISLII